MDQNAAIYVYYGKDSLFFLIRTFYLTKNLNYFFISRHKDKLLSAKIKKYFLLYGFELSTFHRYKNAGG